MISRQEISLGQGPPVLATPLINETYKREESLCVVWVHVLT